MVKKGGRFGKRRSYYKGQPLFDILKGLPDNGVGRLIKRGSHDNADPLTPTYMRIIKADLSNLAIGSDTNPSNKQKQMNKNKRIQVLVERTWRGVTHPRTVNIYSTSYLADFVLIPKEEEEKYLKNSKTPKNYVYWTQAQKKSIRERISQGMSIEEAKQKEKELIAQTDTKSKEEGNVSQDVLENNDTTYCDNFDEQENEEEQCDELSDAEDVNEESGQEKAECEKSTNQSVEKPSINNDSRKEREKRRILSADGDFDHFTEEQQQRVEKMIQQGMHPDTAKQLELERQIGLRLAAMGGAKAADRRFALKRKWSQPSNERKFKRERSSRYH